MRERLSLNVKYKIEGQQRKRKMGKMFHVYGFAVFLLLKSTCTVAIKKQTKESMQRRYQVAFYTTILCAQSARKGNGSSHDLKRDFESFFSCAVASADCNFGQATWSRDGGWRDESKTIGRRREIAGACLLVHWSRRGRIFTACVPFLSLD